MTNISETNDVYRTIFETAPNDKFSVAYFDSGHEGSGSAHAVLFEKPVNLSPAAALSLLWSRKFVFVEEWDLDKSKSLEKIWEYALSGDYMSKEFMRFVTLGAFSPITPSVGRNRIRNRLQEVRFDYRSGREEPYKSFSHQCFGQITSLKDFHDRLTGFEFLQTFEITDDWNDESYFFETHANIGYFSWGTSA